MGTVFEANAADDSDDSNLSSSVCDCTVPAERELVVVTALTDSPTCDAVLDVVFIVSAATASKDQDFAVAEGRQTAASQADAAVAVIVNASSEQCSDGACKLSTSLEPSSFQCVIVSASTGWFI